MREELRTEIYEKYGEGIEDIDFKKYPVKSVRDVEKYYRMEYCQRCKMGLLVEKTNRNSSFYCSDCREDMEYERSEK
jgi:formamidopyrimidine-DNA glycosylase